MTRSLLLSRIAVAAALCAAVPSVARADSVPPNTVTAPRVTHAVPRVRRPVSDTASKPERARGERLPAVKRRPVRGRNGAPSAPATSGSGSGAYVPDQPWETEFFVSNTLQDRRSRFVHFASMRSY
jgi:hypothetical protein